MIVSRYTFCFSYGSDEWYVYNTLSNALLEIDKDSFKLLKDAQSGKRRLKKDLFDQELWAVLTDKRFIVNNCKDEFLVYKSIINAQRTQTEFMHLTIAPTMDCNFRCHYCFQNNKRHSYMQPDVMEAIVKHVASQTGLKRIRLTWFGGEPLMAIEQIRELYGKLKAQFNGELTSNIITTGYHLSEEIISILQEIEVKDMQLTLDGDRENHNRIKYIPECDDVFSKVLANLDLLTRMMPEIHVTIRVNLTKNNAKDYVPLYKTLTERYAGKNLGIAPAFVKDRISRQPCNASHCYGREESARFVLGLFLNEGIHSPWLRYPQRFIAECAIRDLRAISFDPEGYAYKCWEVIGDTRYAIGKLAKDGSLKEPNHVALNRQLYGADPAENKKCAACSYLPLCNGGCPIQRIQNEFENYRNDVCTPMKGLLPEFLTAHIALKKAGWANY